MDFDIIAEDSDRHAILVVEVEPKALRPEDIDRFVDHFSRENVPYGLLVDPTEIRLVKGEPGTEEHLIKSILIAEDVLRFYDPEFSKEQRFVSPEIRRDYLKSLVEAWLVDLAYHWKSETPPGVEVIASEGLLDRLAAGTIRSNVNIQISPLH